MALTIKNPETISLARRLAQQTGTTQTGAITTALQQALMVTSPDAKRTRVDAILHDIWSRQTPADYSRIEQNLAGLYDERGLPS
jgi:antitoxin VapB